MENDGYNYIVEEEPVYYLSLSKPSIDNYSQDAVNDIPCWSLAALLNVLEHPTLEEDTMDDGKIGWVVSVYYDYIRYDSTWHDNPIDACYEMIIDLHEMKKL